MFTVDKVALERPLISEHTDEGHFYRHKDTNELYTSITTLFKLVEPADKQDWYQGWVTHVMNKEKLNREDAIKWCQDYGKASMDIGTALHSLAEQHLNNGEFDITIPHYLEIDVFELFEPLKKWLDKNIDIVHQTEGSMHSETLKLAGTVDLVCTLKDGRKVIIDFKNSRKPKTPGKIKDAHYYEQMCAYGKMWEYYTGEKIETGIVLVVSWDGKVRAFETKLADHEESLWDWLVRYEIYKILK